MSPKIITIAADVSFWRVLKRTSGFNFSLPASLSTTKNLHGCIFTDDGALVAFCIISSISDLGILTCSSNTFTDFLFNTTSSKSLFFISKFSLVFFYKIKLYAICYILQIICLKILMIFNFESKITSTHQFTIMKFLIYQNNE